jgi:hypothetical protein
MMDSMTITVVAQVATPRGFCQQTTDLAGDPDSFWLPASGFQHLQPKNLRVLMDHDEGFAVGHVVHLERSAIDGLLAVGVLDVDIADMLSDGPWFVSPRVRTSGGPLQLGCAQLREISLTRSPATVNTLPVKWSHTDIRTTSGGAPFGLPLRWHGALDRAHARCTSYAHRRMDSLLIDDLDLEAPKPTPKPKVLATATRSAPTSEFGPPMRRTFGTVLSLS